MWWVALAVVWAAAVAGPAVDLIDAALRGDAAAVQTLLAKGIDVNAKRTDGVTALMASSQNGHGEVVQALLAKGADVIAKATNGATALMQASQHGYGEVGGSIAAGRRHTMTASGSDRELPARPAELR